MNNTIKVLNIIALVAVIALLGGCFSPWAGDGATITINVGGGSGRAVFPPDDATLAQIRYTVELQGPSNITEQLAHGTQSINLSVIPGDYTITVTARLADGELYAISIATAVARAGQSTRVDILMNYVGDGFIIFFETGDGSYIDSQIVRRGEKVERPDNPTWGYYGFVNWYSDKDLKNKFDFDEPVISSVTSKITLYAKWNTVTHTVTFDSNNDSAIASEIVGDGGTLPPPKEDPILNGSVFGGWYIDDDEYVFNTEIYADITLCAKWNDAIFDDIAGLGAYLSKWSANDADNPYTVSLKVNDISTLRETLNANGTKYVYFDLSGSNTITTIPANTFYGSANPRGCATLTGITIPNSVETIGNGAFRSCANLTGVTIGNNVTNIGTQVFTGCPRLEEININPNNNNYSSDNGVFYDRNKTVLIAYPSATGSITTIPNSVTTIGDYAFQSCTSLNSVTIGSGVTTIGTYAFSLCTQLDDVTFTSPSQVTTIGQYAFQGCANLTSITIPDSVTSIGNGAFIQCTELTSVTIGSGVKTIGESAFSSCSKLGTVTIPDSVISIGNGAFGFCTSLTEITIPDSVTTIGNSPFMQCTNLATITIGSGVTTIRYLGCDNLTSITIGSGVTTIDQYSFLPLTKLTSITLNANIESGDFRNITSLTSVTIGSGVTTIGSNAFGGCNKLDTVTFTLPSQVTTIGEVAFGGCASLAEITIPNSVTTIGRNAFVGCNKLDNVTFTLPSQVTTIGEEAFGFCTNLTSITIPNSVTSINNAFRYCTGLASVTIPSSVITIGNGAFFGCDNLTSVTFATGSNITYANFGNSAFPEGNNSGDVGNALKNAYDAASPKAGTYTRQEGGTTWTKS
jgi:hypothetical protein